MHSRLRVRAPHQKVHYCEADERAIAARDSAEAAAREGRSILQGLKDPDSLGFERDCDLGGSPVLQRRSIVTA